MDPSPSLVDSLIIPRLLVAALAVGVATLRAPLDAASQTVGRWELDDSDPGALGQYEAARSGSCGEPGGNPNYYRCEESKRKQLRQVDQDRVVRYLVHNYEAAAAADDYGASSLLTAVGRVGGDVALDYLANEIRTDPPRRTWLRKHVALALSQLADVRAVPVATWLYAASTSDPELRRSSLRAVVQNSFGQPRRDIVHDPRLRRQFLGAPVWMMEPEGAAKQDREDAEAWLKQVAQTDPDRGVSLGAERWLTAIEERRDPKVAWPLSADRWEMDDSDPEMRARFESWSRECRGVPFPDDCEKMLFDTDSERLKAYLVRNYQGAADAADTSALYLLHVILASETPRARAFVEEEARSHSRPPWIWKGALEALFEVEDRQLIGTAMLIFEERRDPMAGRRAMWLAIKNAFGGRGRQPGQWQHRPKNATDEDRARVISWLHQIADNEPSLGHVARSLLRDLEEQGAEMTHDGATGTKSHGEPSR